MASVAPEVVVEGTVAAPVGGEAVVAGTVVAAPPGGVVVGTVVGATGHPALLALPPGVEYVREGTGKNKSELQTAPLLPTDAVVDVVALDRSMFDAANAAKRRVHLCNGAPGTLDIEQSLCVALGGPFVPPWTAHFVFFCPCVLGPQICNLIFPHKDMEVPPWADHALIVTDKGVVGRRYMRPDGEQAKRQAHYARFNREVPPYARDVNAISWSGFDVDRNVRIRSYDTPRCTPSCDPMIPQFMGRWDPLVVGPYFGLVVPCCRCICIQPKEPGLYRATIFSKHTTTVWTGGEKPRSVKIPTGSIDLLALARSPEELRSSLRALKERYLDSLPRLR